MGLLVAALTLGCSGASKRVFVHPEADLSFYTKVGVVPFNSHAGDRFAGEKFAIEFTTALLQLDVFDVVDYGVFVNQVTAAIGKRSEPGGLSAEQLKKSGEASGVQGGFYGTGMQYEMVTSGSGSFPVISVEARFLDVHTGTVVWMATYTERGGPKTPIVGWGEVRTLGELTQKMCQQMTSKLK